MKPVVLLLLCLFLVLLAAPLAAQTVDLPRLSLKRVSASLGADGEWQTKGLDFDKETQFIPVFAAAYKLGNGLSAVGSARYGFTDQEKRYALGLRYSFFRDGKWVAP